MPVFGSKSDWDGWHHWTPKTLGQLYKHVIEAHGAHALNKPVPGNTYRKMYKPITDVDNPSFRRMPSDIRIESPARLFETTTRRYKGKIYFESKTYWHFHYSYEYAGKRMFDVMAVSLLSYCYIPTTLEYKKSSQQLSLFTS